MSQAKTKPTDLNVIKFIESIENEARKEDSLVLLDIMKEVTQEEPVMWGPSIIGFGTYSYKYASGREGEWMRTGFSPRKQNLTLYIMSGFTYVSKEMENLGEFKTGKSCLYLKRLQDIDESKLRALIKKSIGKFDE